jgi:hypothetical protein
MKAQIIFAGLIAWVLMLTGCKKEDAESIDASVAEASDSRYSESEEDSTGHPGKCRITEIEVSALPEAIKTYISTNFNGAVIEKAGTTPEGNYLIGIKKSDGTPSGLLFDEAGAFVSDKPLPPHPHIGTPVAAADLPETVTSCVNSNYPGSSIERADKRPDNSFVVLVKKADSTLVVLAFDASGNFSEELPFPPKHSDGKKDMKRKR